ncbi:MAG: ABC transporter permease [Elioraea tepidiphila]
MLQHIVRRLLTAVPVMFGVLLIGFVLLQVVPTDPATVRAGPMATPDVIEAIRRDLGLDRPLWEQFLRYLWRLAQGDLGVSIINNVPVAQELGATIGPTLELMLASLVWSIPLGLLLGTVAAYWRGSLFDRAVMAFAVAGVSIPVFFVGLVLIWYVGFKWQLLPFTGRGGPVWTIEGLRAIALPALTLGGVFVGPIARMTRTAVLDVLSADHVRTARAKGAPERRVILNHALPNASIPIITVAGLDFATLVSGALIVEAVFAWPGMGKLIYDAILGNDYNLALLALMLTAIVTLLANLLADLAQIAIDPRLRS